MRHRKYSCYMYAIVHYNDQARIKAYAAELEMNVSQTIRMMIDDHFEANNMPLLEPTIVGGDGRLRKKGI